MDASQRAPMQRAVVAGALIGGAITAFMMSPKMRRWFKDNYEKVGGDETVNSLKEHTREGVDAVKSTAKNVKQDLKDAKSRAKAYHHDLGDEHNLDV